MLMRRQAIQYETFIYNPLKKRFSTGGEALNVAKSLRHARKICERYGELHSTLVEVARALLPSLKRQLAQ
jgi:hypothetical protein